MSAKDAKITAADFVQIERDIRSGKWIPTLCTMLEQEPELRDCVITRLEKIRRIESGFGLSIGQQASLNKQISLLLWMPLIALDRAHRRLWSDLVPAESAPAQDDEGGGGAP